ncbi:HAD family hydrolase [Agromyces sp. NPDC055520]
MTHFDAVIFDCDGVLVDSEILSAGVSQRILADLGWHVDLATMMEMFVGCSHEFFVEQTERHIGRRLEPGWSVPYRGWLETAFRAELKAVPGITRALDRITLPTAVASNSRHERIRMSLNIVGLLQRFDGRISSAEDVAAGKPEPDVYLHAADILGVPPERCIAIDDSRFGVEAAQRAGMYVLAYAGHGYADQLPGGDRVFPLHDLDALPDVVDRLTSTGDPG